MGARFIAYLEQAGEGCDYTIACGKRLYELSGSTREEAIESLRKMIFEDGSGYGAESDYRLKRITLYEVADTDSIPINEWYAEYEAEQKRKYEEQTSEAERKLYDELHKKYGSAWRS